MNEALKKLRDRIDSLFHHAKQLLPNPDLLPQRENDPRHKNKLVLLVDCYTGAIACLEDAESTDKLAHVMKENVSLRLALDDGMIALHDKLDTARKRIDELSAALNAAKEDRA